MSIYLNALPILVVALPLLGAGAVAWAARRGEKVRSSVTNWFTAGTFFLAFWQFMTVSANGIIEFSLDWYVGFGLHFKVDFISALFALVVALVWLLATIFAREYMEHGENQTRFFIASIFTLGSTLGVFLAGDLLSFFLFFELMTFAAYLLVIHDETIEAVGAANVYLFMSVIGGLFLLGAMFFIQNTVGNTDFIPVLADLTQAGFNMWWLFVVVLLGLGVKAGMLPLHIWLPKAHPVAPAPASALLSAIMIKTGVYGFIRFFYVIFTAPDLKELFYIQENFGYAFIWIGAVTMLLGAIMALIHSPIKRILAYSSISQMGYILFSLGVGVMLGEEGSIGFAGAWMHMINHAFFKSFLFLLAGAIQMQTNELDLNKLGGLGRFMPLTFGFFLVAASGITGIPCFNGYVSKVLIHDGILDAFALKGWPSLLWLERIFVFTGGLTAGYISKIWLKSFLGKPKRDWSYVQDVSRTHKFVFAIYTVILVAIGLGGQSTLNQLVLPALNITNFNTESVNQLSKISFWDVHELQGPLLSYGIAISVLVFQALLGSKISIPRWWSVEILVYRPLYFIATESFRGLAKIGTVKLDFGTRLSHWPRRQKKHRDFNPVRWFRKRTNLVFDTLLMVMVVLIVLALLYFR